MTRGEKETERMLKEVSSPSCTPWGRGERRPWHLPAEASASLTPPRALRRVSRVCTGAKEVIYIYQHSFFLGDRQTTYLGFLGSHYRCLDKACTRREHKEGSWERRVQRQRALRTTAALGIAGESSAQLFVKEMDSCLCKSYSPFFFLFSWSSFQPTSHLPYNYLSIPNRFLYNHTPFDMYTYFGTHFLYKLYSPFHI